MLNNKKFIFIRDMLLVLLGLSLLGMLLYFLWSIFFPFVIALVFTYLLNPLISKLSDSFFGNRLRTIIIIYVLFIGVFSCLVIFFVPSLLKQSYSIQNNILAYAVVMQEALDSIIALLTKAVPPLQGLQFDIIGRLQPLSTNMQGTPEHATQILSLVLSFLSVVILVPFASFFFLKDGPSFQRFFFDLIPNRYYELLRNLISRMDEQLGNYLRGQLMQAVIIASIVALGLAIMGVKYFFVIGIVAGIANWIPYFGPAIGAMPALAVVIVDSGVSTDKIIYVVALFLIVQLIDNFFIQPTVVGGAVNLHPLVVMLAIMIGGSFGGMGAMLLAVPVVSILRIVVLVIKEEYVFRKYRLLSDS